MRWNGMEWNGTEQNRTHVLLGIRIWFLLFETPLVVVLWVMGLMETYFQWNFPINCIAKCWKIFHLKWDSIKWVDHLCFWNLLLTNWLKLYKVILYPEMTFEYKKTKKEGTWRPVPSSIKLLISSFLQTII